MHVNQDGVARGINPFTHGSALHTDVMKTQALRQALDQYGFDAAFGGARRDEEKVARQGAHLLVAHRAASLGPEVTSARSCGNSTTRACNKGESMRVFPLSNWTELDVWQYIHLRKFPIVPLYFAKRGRWSSATARLIMVDDDRLPLDGASSRRCKPVRFRTLGCYPLTGAIESTAATTADIIRRCSTADFRTARPRHR